MLVTLSGIVMLVRSLQPSNVYDPMLLTPAWIVTFVMLRYEDRNILESPEESEQTYCGIVTSNKRLQP